MQRTLVDLQRARPAPCPNSFVAELSELMMSTSLARRALRLAPVVWVTFGLVQCAQSWVYALAAGRAWSLAQALVGSMPWWLSWLALTPLIAWLAERYPFV